MKKVRSLAPSYDHRVEWQAGRVGRFDERYILDNGAFKAHKDGTEWDSSTFVKSLNELDSKMPRQPDFVILPDILGGGQQSLKRSVKWADRINHPKLIPIQDGMKAKRVIGVVKNLDIDGLFIGGTTNWKLKNAEEITKKAKSEGLWVHLGRPKNILWAENIGVDSVDTTNFVRNQSWDKLKAIEEQTTLI